MPDGIFALGDDPDFNDFLGVATNAQLNNNVFCDVVDPVTIQPTASMTEEGSVICPFPTPQLTVEKAVRLSWPGYNNDYVIEVADTPKGPWTEANVKTEKEDGALVAFVPAEESHKYFRLRQR